MNNSAETTHWREARRRSARDDILEAANSYARIMMAAMPLTFAFILMTAMMRGVGDTLTPLLALVLSTVVGLAVTPALIRG